MSKKTAMINMGGRLEANTEYVATINDIEVMEKAIRYPDSLRYTTDKRSLRTVGDLTEEERKIFDETPLRPFMYQGVESTDKDGNVRMEPKASDRIRFVFQIDDTGSLTSMYDFAFDLYENFKPTKKFKDFVKKATGQSIDERSGMLDLWDLFPEGSKYTIKTNPTLRDGKWASFDQSSLKPYKSTNNTYVTKSTSEEDVLNLFKEMIKKNGGPIQAMDALAKGAGLMTDPAEWSETYKNLKNTGKIVVEGGMLRVA